MDAVSELLGEVRARGAIFRQTIVRPPWALRMASGAPLTLATMLRRHAWIVPDQHEPVPIGVGDIAVIRGDVPYTVADDPATTPSLVVTSADYCPGANGIERASWPARTCGTPTEGAAVLLSGAFERRGELSERLLRALPAVLVVPAQDSPAPSVETVAEEIARDRPGQQLVLDRLLDLMLVCALRGWFDNPDADAPAWCRALDDPVVGTALRLLHDTPARPWTVADLAAEAGVSRAALARRFTALVGEPPMSYLTGWRIALAADLLRETDHTVGTIAKKVGYANAFALSVAFKRLRGTRPSDHRSPEPAWRADRRSPTTPPG
ncbi:AraC family transcriptional regulator [Frankia sp. CNm7]|uniref:AraC family transcriptional regulator n=1 Tax=Frankia nepalensis TaxID=1836974 RepID=A0A937RUM3_9ACTN|nr:AraC family transcriptional regulator [Frankia nepalensis]MBL7498099.1 AraC family transcriptional regulator [Frankia nepalensis]MBL7509285.1 AraC family transcriptional regulator [Frankia nepalensis]MBL7524484.1 AraC family transcriptional regulator [Frankia nepalensis]MBL7633128.1 AraC family transcriptional regulator [Frankia nepalensis]